MADGKKMIRRGERLAVMSFLLLVPVPLLLLPACAGSVSSPGWGTSGGSAPSSYQQCVNPYGASNPACVSAGVTPGQALAPAAVRGGQSLGATVRAAESLLGFITVTRFLDEAQKDAVETILKACVEEANKSVDEKLFGKNRTLPDSECEKTPTVEKKLAPTWARHLGKLKHAAAFECIDTRLSQEFPDNFSIEPRLRKDQITEEVLLTDRWEGSLRPDIVIHFARNATRIQCIYDLKFPCGYEVGNPWSPYVERQLDSYAKLGGECRPALITPLDGILRK